MNLGDTTMYGRWAGLTLIVLCWIQVIPLFYGWIGFGIAGLSWIVETTSKKNSDVSKNDGNSGETT